MCPVYGKFANILFCAVSLCCYVLSVLGFDIHTCGDNGRIYIEPLAVGISCERIHPEAPCHHHCCNCCDDGEDCCSDTIAVLSLSGDGPAVSVQLPTPIQIPLFTVETPDVTVRFREAGVQNRIMTDPPGPPAQKLSLLCVRRV